MTDILAIQRLQTVLSPFKSFQSEVVNSLNPKEIYAVWQFKEAEALRAWLDWEDNKKGEYLEKVRQCFNDIVRLNRCLDNCTAYRLSFLQTESKEYPSSELPPAVSLDFRRAVLSTLHAEKFHLKDAEAVISMGFNNRDFLSTVRKLIFSYAAKLLQARYDIPKQRDLQQRLEKLNQWMSRYRDRFINQPGLMSRDMAELLVLAYQGAVGFLQTINRLFISFSFSHEDAAQVVSRALDRLKLAFRAFDERNDIFTLKLLGLLVFGSYMSIRTYNRRHREDYSQGTVSFLQH